MNSQTANLPFRPPEVGELVEVRSRRWLVESVEEGTPPASARVSLACADDDAQGQILEVYWDFEIDRRIVEQEAWRDIGARGFDAPRQFSAFLHTLRWNCITATDPRLFQAPFRAGLKIDAYQMEPLRKALRLPRVNLFIADDTGLGKTIEAGLIARELLLRKKAKTLVVAAPASVLEQWKAEMEERFGLIFIILDRAYLARMRRERGFGVNPWRTHSRFLVSHNLLVDSNYADPMREWLGERLPGSLLILDEAHHAAPSSGGRYGIETKFTRAIRDLGSRFEHRLFLSATPHNGHSNSFSTLLELLDPYRFTRGVPVRQEALNEVMVRRLKEDIRDVQGGFPKREVRPIRIEGLPDNAPELILSRLLDQYRALREERLQNAPPRARAAAGLLAVGLQQKLLSSIEAFALTLARHRKTVQRQWESSPETSYGKTPDEIGLWRLLIQPPDADDERSELSDAEVESEEEIQIEAINADAESAAPQGNRARALWNQEQALLNRMEDIAQGARGLPDAKTRRLLDWIRDNLCPELPTYGKKPTGAPPRWANRRVLIFTENVVGTKRYLRNVLESAIAGTELAEDRIAAIDGQTAGAKRKEVQLRFNTDPAKEPLRILLATDAAREGLNFQAHCTDLFHFDLPWNPGRIEQRNGRIDRKLQPADEVRCHYFVLPQRAEDRVLEVLVKKTETIKRELGSLSKVIDDEIERRLRKGIPHGKAAELASQIQAADLDVEKKRIAEQELESTRARREDLKVQIDQCRNLLEHSRHWVQFQAKPFRDAMSCALELQGAPPITESTGEDGAPVWRFPNLSGQTQADQSWIATLDTLRTPRKPKQKLADWRKEAPIRPVVFEDAGVLSDATVHLHLEQRMAQRLLARFRSQGFMHHDLSRACLVQAQDSIPRVILLGRLCLFGSSAERLHEQLVPVTARWKEPSRRGGEPLKAYAQEAETITLGNLESALVAPSAPANTISQHLLNNARQDVIDLLPQLEERAAATTARVVQRLQERGVSEANLLTDTLTAQQKRVKKELEKRGNQSAQLELPFNDEERRQLQADVASWQTRLAQFDEDLVSEPARILQFYQVKATRLEPVGLVYLWPDTG